MILSCSDQGLDDALPIQRRQTVTELFIVARSKSMVFFGRLDAPNLVVTIDFT